MSSSRGELQGCGIDFGKAVGVLTLRPKVLATRDDIRYTRQLLLVLYGATAEISDVWQSILQQFASPCEHEGCSPDPLSNDIDAVLYWLLAGYAGPLAMANHGDYYRSPGSRGQRVIVDPPVAHTTLLPLR